MKKPKFDSNSETSNSELQPAKPYQPPAIVSRERLESAANVCSGFGQKSQAGAPSPGGGDCGQRGLQS